MAGLYNCNWNGIFTLTAIFTFPTDFHIFSYCPCMCFVCVCMCVSVSIVTAVVSMLLLLLLWPCCSWISSTLKIELCNCLSCVCAIFYIRHFDIISHFAWFYDWRIYRRKNERRGKITWKKSHQIEENVHMDVSRVQQQQIEVITRLKLNRWTYILEFFSTPNLIVCEVCSTYYVPHMA